VDACLTVIDADGAGFALSPMAFGQLLRAFGEIEAAHPDLVVALSVIVERAADLLGAETAWATLVGPVAVDGHELVATVGGRPARRETFTRDQSLIGAACLETRQILLAADYPDYATRRLGREAGGAVAGEGLASLACAPLLDREEVVGLLYLGWENGQGLEAADQALLFAIASQAGLAIQSSRLRRDLTEGRLTVEHALDINADLALNLLQDDGIDGICRSLSESMGREVGFATVVDAPTAAAPDPAMVEVEVTVGEEIVGALRTRASSLGAQDRVALECGANLIALEVTRSRSAQTVHLRAGSELFGSLIEAVGPYELRVRTKAERLGFDLDLPHRVIAVAGARQLDGSALIEAVRAATGAADGAILLRDEGDHRSALVAWPSTAPEPEAVAAALRRLDTPIGISRPLDSVGQAHGEARACLRFAEKAGRRGELVDGSELGPLRFLLDTAELDSLVEIVDAKLGAVREAEQRGGAPLLSTLEAYLECGGHQGRAAEICGVHTSTLKYRMQRVKELIADPLDGEARFQIWLTCRLLRFLERFELDLFGERTSTAGTDVA
jgi:GAF domain-containing protein